MYTEVGKHFVIKSNKDFVILVARFYQHFGNLLRNSIEGRNERVHCRLRA